MATGKYQKWLEPDGLTLLAAWARDGLSNEQIAKNCGVNPDTLYSWKARFSEISEALARGKEIVDAEVENATHKAATGYTAQVRKTFKLRHVDYDDRGRKVREYETLEVGYDEVHVPANVNAQKFWLINRKPQQWRDKREYEGEATDDPLMRLLGELDEEASVRK